MYYSVFGTIVTLFVGVVASWLVQDKNENQYCLKLLHPVVRKFVKTSTSYASNDILNNNAPQINRKSTVYTMYPVDADAFSGNTDKYTRKTVI